MSLNDVIKIAKTVVTVATAIKAVEELFNPKK